VGFYLVQEARIAANKAKAIEKRQAIASASPGYVLPHRAGGAAGMDTADDFDPFHPGDADDEFRHVGPGDAGLDDPEAWQQEEEGEQAPPDDPWQDEPQMSPVDVDMRPQVQGRLDVNLLPEAVRQGLATVSPDQTQCLARLLKRGRLQQCSTARASVGNLCAHHARFGILKHGLVTESVPHDTAQILLSASLRRGRPGQRTCRWYTYGEMFHSAEALFPARVATMGSLCDLTSSEAQQSLQRTHVVLAMHPEMRRGLKKDAGPASGEEFLSCDKTRCYNGPQGGQRFQWYCPQTFLRELERLRIGATRNECTEQEAMQALSSTSRAPA